LRAGPAIRSNLAMQKGAKGASVKRGTKKSAAKGSGERVAKAAKKRARPAASKPRTSSVRVAIEPRARRDRRESALEILEDLPPLSIVEREAFRALFDDAQCEALGGKTDAAEVCAEAAAWARTIDAALKAHPHALRRYSPARFAFFLEQVRDLGRAIEAQERGYGGDGDGARWLLELSRVAALSVREELLGVLRLLAGGNARERELLEWAAGTAETDEALADSLEGLATHAHKWLERRDPQTLALVASVALRESDVDAGRSAEMALRDAMKGVQAPKAPGEPDLPSTDRVEGRVLLEMRVAMEVFAKAREKNHLVPLLTPGAGTRKVLGGGVAGRR
jgi:hypothetical protein